MAKNRNDYKRDYMARVYHRRVGEGMCTRCGKRQARVGKRQCALCSKKVNRERRRQRAGRRGD